MNSLHIYIYIYIYIGKPDQNNGKDTCTGGPSCASLCAGTSFYQDMKASMLEFWRTTKISTIDQDGSRYMPCANKSHAHHHGSEDSILVQYDEVKELFHDYLSIPGEAGFDSEVIALITLITLNHLEASLILFYMYISCHT